MNVACEKCSAKYAVPDAKVKGRKVRITCKRCGAPIVVDGRDLGAAEPAIAKSAQKPAPAPKVSPAPRAETPPTAIASAVARPTAKSTMLGGLGAPAPTPAAAPAPVTAPAPIASPSPPRTAPIASGGGGGVAVPGAASAPGAMGTKPVQRTMLGGAAAPRTATPIASKAAQKQTLLGGLSPALGAAPAPSLQAAATAGGEREWTVAVTDEDHYEMNTSEVVQAFTQGNIDEETFIWKEGMDDWLTPFEVPEIAAGLRRAGKRPKSENPMAFEDATRVGPSPLDKKSTPKPEETHGVWKEPGDWKPLAAPGLDLSFDDVTVAMAMPQSMQLVEETRDDLAGEQDDVTIQGRSPVLDQLRAEARAKEGLKTLPPPPPAAGSPYVPPAARGAATPPAPAAGSPAPLTSGAKSPTPPRAGLGAGPGPVGQASEPGRLSTGSTSDADELFSDDGPAYEPALHTALLRAPALEAEPVSFDFEPPSEAEPEPTPSAGVGGAEDEQKTGARNEDSVLFSLDSLGTPAAAQAKQDPKPKAKATLLGIAPPAPPRPPGRPAEESLPGVEFGAEAAAPAEPDAAAGAFPPAAFAPPQLTPAVSAGESGSLASGALGSGGYPAVTAGSLESDPLLAAPVSGAYDAGYPAPKKSRAGLYIVLLLLLLVGGGVGVAYAQRLGPFAVTSAGPTAAPPGAGAQVAETPSPTPEPSPETPEPAAGEAPSSAGAAQPEATARGADVSGKKPEDPKPDDSNPDDSKPEDPKPDDSKPEDPKPDDSKPEDPKAEADGPKFDEVAARNALASAAGSAASCKKADGPTGAGRAVVTFAPSGRVTSAIISGAFAGTEVGGCIARIFRGARVPAFSGDPVRVAKTFSID